MRRPQPSKVKELFADISWRKEMRIEGDTRPLNGGAVENVVFTGDRNFRPNGRYLAAHDDTTARVLDRVPSGKD